MLPLLTLNIQGPTEHHSKVHIDTDMFKLVQDQGGAQFEHASDELRANTRFIERVLQDWLIQWNVGLEANRKIIRKELPIFMNFILPGNVVSNDIVYDILTHKMFDHVPPPKWLHLLAEKDTVSMFWAAHLLLDSVDHAIGKGELTSKLGWETLRQGVSDILIDAMQDPRGGFHDIDNMKVMKTLVQLVDPKWLLCGSPAVRSPASYAEKTINYDTANFVADTQPLVMYISFGGHQFTMVLNWAIRVCAILHEQNEIPYFLQHVEGLSRHEELGYATMGQLIAANPRALWLFPQCIEDLTNILRHADDHDRATQTLSHYDAQVLQSRGILMEIISDPLFPETLRRYAYTNKMTRYTHERHLEHDFMSALIRDARWAIVHKEWNDSWDGIRQCISGWLKAARRKFPANEEARMRCCGYLVNESCVSVNMFSNVAAVINEMWLPSWTNTSQLIELSIHSWVQMVTRTSQEDLATANINKVAYVFKFLDSYCNYPDTALTTYEFEALDRILSKLGVVLDDDLLQRYAQAHVSEAPFFWIQPRFIAYLTYCGKVPSHLVHDFWVYVPWDDLPKVLSTNDQFIRKMALVHPSIVEYQDYNSIADEDLMLAVLQGQQRINPVGTNYFPLANALRLMKPSFYDKAILIAPAYTMLWLIENWVLHPSIRGIYIGLRRSELRPLIHTAVQEDGDVIAQVPIEFVSEPLINLALRTATTAASFNNANLATFRTHDLKRKILESNIKNGIDELMDSGQFPEWTKYDMEFLFLGAMKSSFQSTRRLIDRILIASKRLSDEARAAVIEVRKQGSEQPIRDLRAVVKYDLRKYADWCQELATYWPPIPDRTPLPGKHAFDDGVAEVDRVAELDVFSLDVRRMITILPDYEPVWPPRADDTKIGNEIAYVFEVLTSPDSLTVFDWQADTRKRWQNPGGDTLSNKRQKFGALVQAAMGRMEQLCAINLV